MFGTPVQNAVFVDFMVTLYRCDAARGVAPGEHCAPGTESHRVLAGAVAWPWPGRWSPSPGDRVRNTETGQVGTCRAILSYPHSPTLASVDLDNGTPESDLIDRWVPASPASALLTEAATL